MEKVFRTAACVGVVFTLLFAASSPARAQSSVSEVITNVKATFEPPTARRGQTVLLKISLDVAPGWHTYPTRQTTPEAQNFRNEYDFPPSPDVVFVGELKDPTNFSLAPPTDGFLDLRELQGPGTFVWERPVVVTPTTSPGSKSVRVLLKQVQACTTSCLPAGKFELAASLNVSDAAPQEVEEKYRQQVDKAAQPSADKSSKEVPATDAPKEPAGPIAGKEAATELLNYATSAEYKKSLDDLGEKLVRDDDSKSGDLLAFVLQGIFWGLVSLVTPCVFPMIPITVSFFLKQSDREHHKPLLMASVYCGTIVVVLALGALLLLSTFRLLSINPIMNFAMGGLFIFFALSLFGMYEIELPSGLAQFTSSREGRGGIVGTVFMALTFTILSFACVAPFLGGFGGTANTSKLNWFEQSLGALAFSSTFAAPFFVLALFPSLLKKMPKSGTWLNSVKVVMGFLELAAAFKFLRLGELVLHPPSVFTYDLVLGIWVALCLLCGLYLLNVYRLPHDSPLDHLGVPRLLFAALFLGLAFYLMPALFKFTAEGENQRPAGAIYSWVDSFILPEPVHSKGSLVWNADLKQAVDDVREQRRRSGQRKLIFVDLTGKT